MADMRYIATTLGRDDVVALAEFERRVYVFALDPPTLLASFDTVLDAGGERLALCTPERGPVVVVGAYERHGICGYDALTGDRIWQRKDLKRVQRLSPAGDGGLVAAALDRQSMHVLAAITGETQAVVRTADSLWQSKYSPIAVTGWTQQVALIDTTTWERRWRTAGEGYTVLGAALAPDAVIVSDSSGSVSCFDILGAPLWRYLDSDGRRFWPVGRDEDADEWLGLEHSDSPGTADAIVRWSRAGEFVSRRHIPTAVDGAFLPSGRVVVTTDGRMIDSRTGVSRDLPLAPLGDGAA